MQHDPHHDLGLARRHARDASAVPLPSSRVPSQRAEARRAHDRLAVCDDRARWHRTDPRVVTPDFRTRECLDGGGTVQYPPRRKRLRQNAASTWSSSWYVR